MPLCSPPRNQQQDVQSSLSHIITGNSARWTHKRRQQNKHHHAIAARCNSKNTPSQVIARWKLHGVGCLIFMISINYDDWPLAKSPSTLIADVRCGFCWQMKISGRCARGVFCYHNITIKSDFPVIKNTGEWLVMSVVRLSTFQLNWSQTNVHVKLYLIYEPTAGQIARNLCTHVYLFKAIAIQTTDWWDIVLTKANDGYLCQLKMLICVFSNENYRWATRKQNPNYFLERQAIEPTKIKNTRSNVKFSTFTFPMSDVHK